MYNEEKTKVKKNKKQPETILNKFFPKRKKRLLTNIELLFSKIMWCQIIASSFLIIVGLIFLIWPEISTTIVGVIFGLNILLFGGINLYAYMKRKDIPLFKFHLIYGIIGTLLGILTILNPFTFTQVITIFIGLWIIYMAITKIELVIRLKTIKEKSWLLLLVSAILELFMSILIFINPFSNIYITTLAGAYFVLTGVINCTDTILTKNRAIDFLENL